MAVQIQNKPADSTTGTGALSKTYAAVATSTVPHTISGIGWSYAADPAAGDYIKVETVDPGPTTRELFRIYITAKGPGFFPFPAPLAAPRGQSLAVSMTNGNGVSASLAVMNFNGPVSV